MTNYKMGKLPQKVDLRTFQFKKLLITKNLPVLPTSFNNWITFDNFVDNHMYANDKYGCCVISGRGHMSLVFEDFEQKILIPITDSEIVNSYLHESHGQDSGLVMLDSLNVWRKEGWWAGGKAYNIYAFAQIDQLHHDDIKYAILLLRGAYIGLGLPISAQKQIGKVWDIDNGPNGNFGSWGGHCVYVYAYNEIGPICVTWGAPQQMTWSFWDKYCDEAYAIVDNKDVWVDPTTDPLNCSILNEYLVNITNYPVTPPNPNPPNPPTPSPCPVGNGAAKVLNFVPWALHRKGRIYYMNPSKKEEK